MTRIKICGINDPAGFDAAVDGGADYLGFVFFPASPRYVTPEVAAGLSARRSAGPPRVGLFVEPQDDDVARALAAIRLDILQLYVSPMRAAGLRLRFGLPVWRAVGVRAASDLPATADGADALVIEAKPPRGATRPGGNAERFDWSIIAGWHAPAPWVLAGGLTPDNVDAALRATGAPAVDVSSGVETSPGVKDEALIRAFISGVRKRPLK